MFIGPINGISRRGATGRRSAEKEVDCPFYRFDPDPVIIDQDLMYTVRSISREQDRQLMIIISNYNNSKNFSTVISASLMMIHNVQRAISGWLGTVSGRLTGCLRWM